MEWCLRRRGLLGDGLEVGDYTVILPSVEDLTRYAVVHSRPVDAIALHHDFRAANDPKSFFSVPRYGFRVLV